MIDYLMQIQGAHLSLYNYTYVHILFYVTDALEILICFGTQWMT